MRAVHKNLVRVGRIAPAIRQSVVVWEASSAVKGRGEGWDMFAVENQCLARAGGSAKDVENPQMSNVLKRVSRSAQTSS